MENHLVEIWQKTLATMETKISKPSFETWLKATKPIALFDNTIIIGVPNEFARDWLENRYAESIKESIRAVLKQDMNIKFIIPQSNEETYLVHPIEEEPIKTEEAVLPPDKKDNSLEDYNSTPLNPKYVFDTFVVGNSNRFAHAASLAVAEAPAKAYNPLFIYGGVGLGKTHLMHAIGHYVLEQNNKVKVVYISSETFTNELINSIRDDKTVEFRNKYRSIDVLLIDDIQFLAGKERTQEEFFHTFNALHEANKQIIISSDRPPKEIPTLEDRLRSRFEWGLITDIQAPDLETRIAILRKKAELENISVPDEVMIDIAKKIQSNIRELEGALIRVVAYSSLTHKEINVNLAQEALKDIIPNKNRQISVALIQQIVASHFNLKVEDFKAKKRTRNLSYPRQIAMYMAREMTDFSLPKIGEEFGGRDHTTVIHAYDKIKEGMQGDPNLAVTIKELMEKVQNG